MPTLVHKLWFRLNLARSAAASERGREFGVLDKIMDCFEFALQWGQFDSDGSGMCDECTDAGIECYVLAPTKMPQSEEQRKRKTDQRDAQRILEQLRGYILAGNNLAKVWIPDPQVRDDREVLRMRLEIANKLTATRTQVRTLLKRNKTQKPKSVGKSWTRSDREWLKGLTESESELPWGARVGLASLLRQIDALEQEVKEVDEAVKVLAESERYRAAVAALVEKLTGVATLSAMVFLTELGDLRRFVNRRKVGAFLGVVPSSNESGESAKDRKGHITRQGPARVRKVLCQSAWARVTFDPHESKIHARIVEKNPKKKIATVACMRRLGIRMWHIALEAQVEAGVYDSKDMPKSENLAA